MLDNELLHKQPISTTTSDISHGFIYVIGGYTNPRVPVDYISLINTTTGDVSMFPYRLIDQDYIAFAVAIYDDILYLFGGWNNNNVTDKWSKYPLTDSTTSPSYIPSMTPSSTPSQSPSIIPSSSPSQPTITLVATVATSLSTLYNDTTNQIDVSIDQVAGKEFSWTTIIIIFALLGVYV